MDEAAFEEKLGAVLESVKQAHPEMYFETIYDLVRYGEWQIAVETLCDNLHEYGKHIPKEIYQELVFVAESLGVGEEYWGDIEVK